MEIKQTKGLNRNTIDKYYTKDSVVVQCLNFIKIHLNINNNHLIIEPSAGNGSFINSIKSLSNKFIFYDYDNIHDINKSESTNWPVLLLFQDFVKTINI